MHIELGKITSAKFGFGGYQDCQVVFEIQIGGPGWGSAKVYECGWGHITKEEAQKSPNIKWTHQERITEIGEKGWEMIGLMREAKVSSLDKLVGIPIRANFDGPNGRLVSIEVLKEVL